MQTTLRSATELARRVGGVPSAPLLRWQLAVNAAFVGGSLTAALLNIAALIAMSFLQGAMTRIAEDLPGMVSHG